MTQTGLSTFTIDTHDFRAPAEVIGRSRVRLNHQDFQSPNLVRGIRNISMLTPYNDPTNIRAFSDVALKQVSRFVAETNAMAGQYGLVISAFARDDNPNVVTINVGHGNFLSNQS